MSVLLPRLARNEVEALIAEFANLGPAEISAEMPAAGVQFTYGAVGGARAEKALLDEVRENVLLLAREGGFPSERHQASLRRFDADCALMLHEVLPITPHEAGHREVWAGLTAGRLLDVAAWRWDGIGDPKRVNGDLNRDTFRRLWWRAEILSGDPIDIGDLGEDEIVAVMERPGVAGNPQVAKAIARTFLETVASDDRLEAQRMQLMRDAMKRLTRLTPFTSLDVLAPNDLAAVVGEMMEQSVNAVLASRVSGLGSENLSNISL